MITDQNKLTLNANFSRKCDIPLGYATSYLDPASITTETEKSIKTNTIIVKTVVFGNKLNLVKEVVT